MPTKDKSQSALINRIQAKNSFFARFSEQQDFNNGKTKRMNSNGASAGIMLPYTAGSASFTESEIKNLIVKDTPIINPPSQLSSLTSTSITSSGFTVNWSGGEGATSYTYTLNGITATPSSPNNIASRSATFTGLQVNTSYALIITAVNGSGNTISSSFTIITLANVPDSPTNVSATPTNAGATVSWVAPSNGGLALIYYVITVCDAAGNPLSPSQTIYISVRILLDTIAGQPVSSIVTGLINGTAYTFKVSAHNRLGESSLSQASSSIIPRSVPQAPTNSGGMTVVITTQTTITFSFNAPSDTGGIPITGYTLTLSLGSSVNLASSVVPFRIGSTNYAAGQLASIASPGTITILVASSTFITTERYKISISADNAQGSSATLVITQDNPSSIVPDAPTIVQRSSTLQSITFSFTETLQTLSTNIADNFTLGVTLNSSAVAFRIGSTNYSAGQTATINSPGTITVEGLDYSTSTTTNTYNLWLVANNFVGPSPPLIITQATATAYLPNTPRLSGTTTSTGTSITFSFSSGPSISGSLPILEYILSYSSSSPIISSPTFIVNSTTYSSGQSVTGLSTGTVEISGLQNSTTYTFNLYARNSLGNSSPCTIIESTT